jgi:hypothetical protein
MEIERKTTPEGPTLVMTMDSKELDSIREAYELPPEIFEKFLKYLNDGADWSYECSLAGELEHWIRVGRKHLQTPEEL